MRFQSVELLTNDPAATAEFYGQSLGLKIIQEDAAGIHFRAGGSILRFTPGKTERPIYHFAFNIPENKLEEAIRYYSGKVRFIEYEGNIVIDFKAWNAHSFYFFDNNGNILELIARHDLPNATTDTFTPSHLLSVSEVAVVTENVGVFCADFENKTGIGHYVKQPAHENFAALGDAEGLLIVSKENRHWFPTQIPARNYPLKVEIEAGGFIREFSFGNSGSGEAYLNT